MTTEAKEMSNSPKKQSDSELVQDTTGRGSPEPGIDSTGADDGNVSHEQLKGESDAEVVRLPVKNVMDLGSGPPDVVCEVPIAPDEAENFPKKSSCDQSVCESVITEAVSDEGSSKSHGVDQVVPGPNEGSSPICEEVDGSEFSETPGDLESGLKKPVRSKPETSQERDIVAPNDGHDGFGLSGDAHVEKNDVTLRKRGSKVEYVDDLTTGNGGDIPEPIPINARVKDCMESCIKFLTRPGGIVLTIVVILAFSWLVFKIIRIIHFMQNNDSAVSNDTVNVTSFQNQTQESG